jgi:chemotaxis protein methyltransferase CheR
MEESLLQRFRQLIRTKTGLHHRAPEGARLKVSLLARMSACGRPDAESYYQLLAGDSLHGALEWKELIALLSITETYFFRDKGQFALLENRILPELIERRRTRRSLRIWSAGCSTGEEAYSLAILLDQLLPDRDRWALSIVGTDINEPALRTARRGVYGAWSFRGVEPSLARGFRRRGDEWEVEERYRKMVVFRPGNLVTDSFPSLLLDLYEIDLIVCRNVFIYFDSDTLRAILEKMAATLSEDGYLITGHAELHGQVPPTLKSTLFPESVVYHRNRETPQAPPRSVPPLADRELGPHATGRMKDEGGPPRGHPKDERDRLHPSSFRLHPSSFPLLPLRTGLPVRSTSSDEADPHDTLLREAESCLQSGDYPGAIERIERLPAVKAGGYPALYLRARAHANLGEHDRSLDFCRQALQADPQAANPYYLMAQIAEEQGNASEAKNLLRKVVYLTPSSAAAYLELAALYEAEGDAARAHKLRTTALELLQAAPPHSSIEPYGDVTAGELAAQVEKRLAGNR